MTAATMHTLDSSSRLPWMLAIAAILHAAVILGTRFAPLPKETAPPPAPALDIVLVTKPSAKPVKDADYLAQAHAEGGGEASERKRPATRRPGQNAPAEQPLPPQPQREASKASDARAGFLARNAPVEAQAPPTATPSRGPSADTHRELLAQAREVARMTAMAELDEEQSARAPRHRHISARTTEYRYAAYMEAWRRKVEAIGNLNYPDEARRQRIHGSLVLDVAVLPDGSVQEVRTVRSSGHPVLDDAARRIVELAAPYAEFPPDIRKEVDVLHIIRTWQFLEGNQLSAGG